MKTSTARKVHEAGYLLRSLTPYVDMAIRYVPPAERALRRRRNARRIQRILDANDPIHWLRQIPDPSPIHTAHRIRKAN